MRSREEVGIALTCVFASSVCTTDYVYPLVEVLTLYVYISNGHDAAFTFYSSITHMLLKQQLALGR